MVALLFRTLDAWRIFDNLFVMTSGANNTETLSFLAYRQNVDAGEPRAGVGGVGAAVPHGRGDRLHLHQGLQDRPVAGAGVTADGSQPQDQHVVDGLAASLIVAVGAVPARCG